MTRSILLWVECSQQEQFHIDRVLAELLADYDAKRGKNSKHLIPDVSIYVTYKG